PTAVLIGFVGAFVGGLAAMAIMIACNSSVIMIPAAGICFFSGGTCGIFGNAYGGWKGALVGSFIVGMALTGLPLILYPAFAGLGISGASFPNVDYNIIGAFLNWILGIFA
ncbi:MAG: PTS transporter subunit IIC, partial [Clostridium sp.]|nr:PTS transporter subunit IIC [Clostridium sp.]